MCVTSSRYELISIIKLTFDLCSVQGANDGAEKPYSEKVRFQDDVKRRRSLQHSSSSDSFRFIGTGSLRNLDQAHQERFVVYFCLFIGWEVEMPVC